MFKGKFSLLMPDLAKAITSFEQSLQIDFSEYNDFEKDMFKNGPVQKFEYTIEPLWKTIKQFFEEKRNIRIIYSLDVLKAFFAEEVIDEDTYNELYDAIKSRNLLSHVYRLEIFENIYPYLNTYAKAIKRAYAALQSYAV